MKRRLWRRVLRGGVSLALALTTLWAVAAAAPAESLDEAARAFGGSALPMALVRFERGAFFSDPSLSAEALAALRSVPLLYAVRDKAAPVRSIDETEENVPAPVREESDSYAEDASNASLPELIVRDNGVPSTTLRPTDPSGFLVKGSVYVHNTSAASLTQSDLDGGFSAVLTDEAPQVLIVHTHGCEAYTMPSGEEYVESDDHRTLDEAYNVLRVGDEIARVLEDAGVGVLHDRTLHDYPNYSGSYDRSLATVKQYRADYPSLVYVLDVHRDAVADEAGRQYKLLCAEEPNAAQLEFVVGSDGGGLEHPDWRENLKLACAVQSALLNEYPTLMRPIVVRNSRYNQQVTTGSLLLEVGTAGNSLEEALNAARLFAAGFAKTIQGRK
ncbi:MAG: stage II sporulation protein P [Oscillospiraceae bacterium]|nr:stage II sporulation protein P [Oscillospiraceae bacterium]